MKKKETESKISETENLKIKLEEQETRFKKFEVDLKPIQERIAAILEIEQNIGKMYSERARVESE